MSEIRDIQPLHPVWPARPNEGAGDRRRQKRPRPDDDGSGQRDEPEDRDDGVPHVDEYA